MPEDYFFIDHVMERRHARNTNMSTMLLHTENDYGNSFTDEDIADHMIFLMMAAHDTSTSTTTTMIYNLTAHPEWQEQAHEESAQLGYAPFDIDTSEKLEVLNFVMNESLRMVTSLPLNLRQAVRDTNVLGYHMPDETNVTIWPGLNHRLPELCKEPNKFDPEGFAEPLSEHKKHR